MRRVKGVQEHDGDDPLGKCQAFPFLVDYIVRVQLPRVRVHALVCWCVGVLVCWCRKYEERKNELLKLPRGERSMVYQANISTGARTSPLKPEVFLSLTSINLIRFLGLAPRHILIFISTCERTNSLTTPPRTLAA